MANAMKGVTRAMKRMNSKMNLPQIQKIMMEFEKQSEIMDMKEEVMNDAIDEVIGEFYIIVYDIFANCPFSLGLSYQNGPG